MNLDCSVLLTRLEEQTPALKKDRLLKPQGTEEILDSLREDLKNIAFAVLIRPVLIQSPDKGAWPILRAATDPSAAGAQYYGPDGFQQAKGHPIVVRSSAASYDSDTQRQLWEISEKLTGVAFPV
ncbi:hypothetical protein KYC5002_12655 [Archangium violaceum]|uniref:hypothetical protein n=1 Tax=Archangium violaceum TaxID=83451 RepID=UPI002B31C4B1|nr:hypothetical protein KYC5002_12655 [Archangium gephyra]